MLDRLVERGKTMAVLFYDPKDNQDLDIMDELEKIDDECRRFEIDFVKVRRFSDRTRGGHIKRRIIFYNTHLISIIG